MKPKCYFLSNNLHALGSRIVLCDIMIYVYIQTQGIADIEEVTLPYNEVKVDGWCELSTRKRFCNRVSSLMRSLCHDLESYLSTEKANIHIRYYSNI